MFDRCVAALPLLLLLQCGPTRTPLQGTKPGLAPETPIASARPAAPVGPEESAAAQPTSSAHGPADPTPAVQEAAVRLHGKITIGGKSQALHTCELVLEGGEFYFYAKAANQEGVALTLGADLKEGAALSKDRGVTGHILENGNILNVGDASKLTFELTKKAMGTWAKQGRCSGKFRAETTYRGKAIKAEGTFEGAACYEL